jgi:uncharacterized protein YkwD
MFLQGSGVLTKSRAVLIALAAALLLASPAGAAKKKTCKDAKLVATGTAQEARIERATRCLVNKERTKRGLKRLNANAELLKSSDWQANDMLEHQYFDHTRPDGPDFAERILRFGYAENSKGYAIAENIAWATATIATPAKIVSLWMHSPGHRKNILTRGYRDQAISALWSGPGVGGAYAGSGGPFLIFVNQFGVRY